MTITVTNARYFPYRLAAIDLDDTLLSPDKSISAENISAVRALEGLGAMILLASGRRHENMLRFHGMLELKTPIVSCQGALAKETATEEVLYRQCMPPDLAIDVVSEGMARGITQVYYHLDGTYVTVRNRWTELYAERTGTPVRVVPTLREFDGAEPLKVLWVGEPGAMPVLRDEMLLSYHGLAEAVITDPEYLEFMALGVTKSLGVASVAAKYGIPQEQTLAFGDGNNDVTMLEWAGMGVAMDHGRASAKSAADLVAPVGDPAASFARGVELVLQNL